MTDNEKLQVQYDNTSANQHLLEQLTWMMETLRTERDRLNQTLKAIWQFSDFPVDNYCPVTDNVTQGTQKYRHLFQQTTCMWYSEINSQFFCISGHTN